MFIEELKEEVVEEDLQGEIKMNWKEVLKAHCGTEKTDEKMLYGEQKKLDKINAREIQKVAYKDTSKAKPMKPYGKTSTISNLRDKLDK